MYAAAFSSDPHRGLSPYRNEFVATRPAERILSSRRDRDQDEVTRRLSQAPIQAKVSVYQLMRLRKKQNVTA